MYIFPYSSNHDGCNPWWVEKKHISIKRPGIEEKMIPWQLAGVGVDSNRHQINSDDNSLQRLILYVATGKDVPNYCIGDGAYRFHGLCNICSGRCSCIRESLLLWWGVYLGAKYSTNTSSNAFSKQRPSLTPNIEPIFTSIYTLYYIASPGGEAITGEGIT